MFWWCGVCDGNAWFQSVKQNFQKNSNVHGLDWSRPLSCFRTLITAVTSTSTTHHARYKEKGEENFARGGHALSLRPWPWLCTTITAVRNPVTTARLPLLSPLLHHTGDQFSWTWSQPWSSSSIMIRPVTISSRHDHARDQCPVFSYVLFLFSKCILQVVMCCSLPI